MWEWNLIRDLLRQISVPGILACGMTIVIVSGGVDLSVGSVLALSGMTFALTSLHAQWPAAAAIGAAVAVGALAGWVTGWLHARFKLQPFVASLAMMVFARGAAKTLTGGQKVSQTFGGVDGAAPAELRELPQIFKMLDSRVLGDRLAVVTLVFLGCAVVTAVLLTRLRFGRYLYAIGGGEEAAWLSGVPVRRVKIGAYLLSGAFAALAGICQVAQEQQGDPEAGLGYELTAIAMVVIGGTSLAGGQGGMGRTLLGTLAIGLIEKVLSLHAVTESTRLMLTGAIIVAAAVSPSGAAAAAFARLAARAKNLTRPPWRRLNTAR